jgi:16S rRNA processing protein RimM
MWKVKDIAGSEVVDEAGQVIGELTDVLPTKANDVWSVRAPDGTELLIPALKNIIKEVDLAKKRIVVALPSGLKEVYETKNP